MKKLDKIERIERDPRDGKALGFEFEPPERSGRVVFELENGALRAGDARAARRRRDLARARRARHARRRQRRRQDDADRDARRRRELDAGKLRRGHNVKLGYLSQHAEELGARRGTVLEAAQRATGLTPNKARALLGRFLFSGEEAEKPLDGLCGGERRRLSLAILVALAARTS